MDEITRTYRFEMTIFVEPGHTAYLDPEWAADAAASALSDGYGLDAFYGDVVLRGDEQHALMTEAEAGQQMRTYRFSVTFEVDPDHFAYGHPEWVADASHGTLTNAYGIKCEYARPHAVDAE